MALFFRNGFVRNDAILGSADGQPILAVNTPGSSTPPFANFNGFMRRTIAGNGDNKLLNTIITALTNTYTRAGFLRMTTDDTLAIARQPTLTFWQGGFLRSGDPLTFGALAFVFTADPGIGATAMRSGIVRAARGDLLLG